MATHVFVAGAHYALFYLSEKKAFAESDGEALHRHDVLLSIVIHYFVRLVVVQRAYLLQ